MATSLRLAQLSSVGTCAGGVVPYATKGALVGPLVMRWLTMLGYCAGDFGMRRSLEPGSTWSDGMTCSPGPKLEKYAVIAGTIVFSEADHGQTYWPPPCGVVASGV